MGGLSERGSLKTWGLRGEEETGQKRGLKHFEHKAALLALAAVARSASASSPATRSVLPTSFHFNINRFKT